MARQALKRESLNPQHFVHNCRPMEREKNVIGVSPLETAAYHQGGHAVMAYIHHEFLRDGVGISDDGTGYCTLQDRYRTRQIRQRKERWRVRRSFSRRETKIDVQIALAGPIAELIFLGRSGTEDLTKTPDWERVERRLADMYPRFSSVVLHWLVEPGQSRAAGILSDPLNWKAVIEIAHGLVKRRKVSGDDVERICGQIGVHRFGE